MAIFHKIGCLACLGLTLSACGGETNRSLRTANPRSPVVFPNDGQLAVVKMDANGIVVANLDPQAQTTQIVQGSPSSRIKGYSVAFPPGAISITTSISVQEGETFAAEELKSSAGIPEGTQITGSSPPISVNASSPIDLAVPMILAISVPTILSLGDDPIPLERMGVIYRVTVQATGERLAGVVPAASLALQGNKVLYPSKYFGWFQLTVFDQAIRESQQKDPSLWFKAMSILTIGQAMPSCGLADVGRTVYVQEKGIFSYCNGSSWSDIDLKGPQGPAGATAPASKSIGYSLVDKNLKKMHISAGNSYLAASVVVGSRADSNLGVMGVNFETGDYVGGLCSSYSGSDNFCHCHYSNSDCSQPADRCVVRGKPMRNALFKLSSGSWVRALGTESTTLALHDPSFYFDGKQCRPIYSNVENLSSSYEVSTPYTYPEGLATVPTTDLPLSVDQ
jgi:hypothetical protein